MRIAPAIGAACLVAALAACTRGHASRPEAPPAATLSRDFASGARLRATIHAVAGIEVLVGFFDAELGAPCAFVDNLGRNVGPGASYHCLPSSKSRHAAEVGPYADAACTQPVAVVPPEGPPAYAVVEPRDACQTPRAVHRVGRVESRLPYFRDAGVCVRSDSRAYVQPLAEAIPIDAFVRATERIVELGGRIGAVELVAEDGARQPLEGYDHARREAVRVAEAEDGLWRWVPSRVAFRGAGDLFWGDAFCTQPVATKIGRDAACPLTGASVFLGTCGRAAAFALGPPVAASRARRLDEAGVCTAAASSAGGFLSFELGAHVPPEALAPALALEVGDGAVRRRGFVGSGDAVAAWGDLVDARTGEPCEVVLASDGLERCLPKTSAQVTFFADAECTVPALLNAPTGCERGPFPRFVRADGTGTGRGARVFEVTGPAPGVYARQDGRCAPVTRDPRTEGFALAEADVALFPEGEALTE